MLHDDVTSKSSQGSSVSAALHNIAHFPRVLRFLRKAGISTAGAAGLSLALDVALSTIVDIQHTQLVNNSTAEQVGCQIITVLFNP